MDTTTPNRKGSEGDIEPFVAAEAIHPALSVQPHERGGQAPPPSTRREIVAVRLAATLIVLMVIGMVALVPLALLTA